MQRCDGVFRNDGTGHLVSGNQILHKEVTSHEGNAESGPYTTTMVRCQAHMIEANKRLAEVEEPPLDPAYMAYLEERERMVHLTAKTARNGRAWCGAENGDGKRSTKISEVTCSDCRTAGNTVDNRDRITTIDAINLSERRRKTMRVCPFGRVAVLGLKGCFVRAYCGKILPLWPHG